MEKSKTLILIDGHALAFRQFYALERSNMRTSNGTPTWAVYGFFKSIFDLLKSERFKPDAICVAFDVSHQTFRVEEYSEYKSNRVSMPDEMQSQMDLIYEGLKAFNIPIYTKEGYEADDVIGTISKRACELGHKVFILTGDQDAFQLIDKDGCVKVVLPTKGVLVEYGWERVYEKLSIYPDQVVDYKSLRGDTSDCIPGVKGIGEKTAVKLLEEYGHLQNILDACPDMPESNIKRCLCNDIEMAKKSYFLATIVRDVDIEFNFDDTKIILPDVGEVTKFLKDMQFYSFLKNINQILASFDKNKLIEKFKEPKKESDKIVVQQASQLGLFTEAVKEQINKTDLNYERKIITKSDELANLVNVLKEKSLLSLDVRADNDKVYGIGIAYNDNYTADNIIKYSNKQNLTRIFYIPNQDNLFEILKPVLENANIKKIGYDTKVLYKNLRNVNIDTNGIIFDILMASYVKNPSRNHTLEAQSVENINHLLVNACPVDSHVETISIYVSDVLASVFELAKFWISELDDKELKIMYDIESPLTVVLGKMEYTGVSIDSEYLKEFSDYMTSLVAEIEQKIYKLAGEKFNIGSPKQVGEILFDKLGLKGKKKRANKYSTSAEVLEELGQEYEIANRILEYRKYTKLKSTYTDSLPALISPRDNRVHTTYNQATTSTGRLSSSNPNLQNIPIRTEEGSKIRRAFVPKDRQDALILSADYSQIELRILAHFSKDANLIEAFKSGEDIHTITASKVFEVPVDKVTKEMRYRSKAVNFGIVYGQSKYGLGKSLGISANDAEKFINKYFETYPMLKKYMEDMVEFAQKYGYTETMFGRKRNFAAELNSSNHMIQEFAKRAAINHPMQGTAADLIKLAMVDLQHRMEELNLKSKLIIQVHDELVIETYKDELEVVKQAVKSAMELGQPLLVPLVIDIETGETWQE